MAYNRKIFKIRFCSIYECLRVTMINKVLFNRLEQDSNLDSLREAYQIDTLDWTFIRALYFVSRRMKTEHKFNEKNFKNTAERVIPRLINLLQWIDDQESSNQKTSYIYKTFEGIRDPRTNSYLRTDLFFDTWWIHNSRFEEF